MSEVDEELINKLIQEFEKRIPESQKLPPFYPFENEGDFIIGKYMKSIMFHDYRNNRDREVLIIHNIRDDKEYSISRTTNIDRLWKELEIKPSDYVMIRFEGTRETSGGRKFKRFTVSKMSEDEFNTIINKHRELLKVIKKPEEKKEEIKKEKIEEKKPTNETEDIRNFLIRIFNFYDEMSYADLDKRLKFKGYKITIEQLKSIISDILEFDDDKKMVRKK